jgi:hypothetical protein
LLYRGQRLWGSRQGGPGVCGGGAGQQKVGSVWYLCGRWVIERERERAGQNAAATRGAKGTRLFKGRRQRRRRYRCLLQSSTA